MRLFQLGPHRAALALALLLVASGCDSSVSGPGENVEQLEGRLIYGLDDPESGWPNNMSQLRSVLTDGSDPRTYHASDAAYLSPSPDGTRVVFQWLDAVFVGDVQSVTRTHELDDTYDYVTEKQWSPDGSWVAYHRRRFDGNAIGLEVASATGPTLTKVNELFAAAVPCAGGDPETIPLVFRQWTSSRMVFMWSRCGQPDLHYSINPDGTDLQEIANSSPRWLSPDGSRVLYLLAGVPWASDPDGGNAVALSTSGGQFFSSDWMLPYPWSPDGASIVLLRTIDTCEQPHLIAADGSSERPLADEGCWMFHSWSPDGQWVAATRTDTHVGAVIYLFKRDGSAQRTLTVAAPSLKVMDVAWLPEP